MPARLSGSGRYVRKAGGGLAFCLRLVLSYTLLTDPRPGFRHQNWLADTGAGAFAYPSTLQLFFVVVCFCCFSPCYRYQWQPLWRLSAVCVCATPQAEQEGGPIVHPLPVLGMGSLFWRPELRPKSAWVGAFYRLNFRQLYLLIFVSCCDWSICWLGSADSHWLCRLLFLRGGDYLFGQTGTIWYTDLTDSWHHVVCDPVKADFHIWSCSAVRDPVLADWLLRADFNMYIYIHSKYDGCCDCRLMTLVLWLIWIMMTLC